MGRFDQEEDNTKRSATREAIDRWSFAKREVLAYDTEENSYYPCDIEDVEPGQRYIQDGEEKQKPFDDKELLEKIEENFEEGNLVDRVKDYESSKISNGESLSADECLDGDKTGSYDDFDDEDEVVTYLDEDGVLDSIYLSQVPAGGYYITKNGEYLQKPFKLIPKYNVEEVEPLIEDDVPWDFDPDEAARLEAEQTAQEEEYKRLQDQAEVLYGFGRSKKK